MKKLALILAASINIFAFDSDPETINLLCDQIDHAFYCSENYRTDLPQSIFNIRGMSSIKNRIFLNEIGKISHKLTAKYLEIGVWMGSTFISSNYNNNYKISYAVDNWSEFYGPRETFYKNLKSYDLPNIKTLDVDCFSNSFLDSLAGTKFDVYFYDGAHKEIDQYNAFKKLDPYLDDVFIAIVDDWSWPDVKRGTMRAFDELGYKVIKNLDLNSNESDPSGYWNGILVALIQKKK